MPYGYDALDLLRALKARSDNTLINFTKGIFRVLKDANPNKEENVTTEDQKALDTLAKLLVGDEICLAIALSGTEILLATNQELHIDEYITYHKAFKILSKDVKHGEYIIQFVDKLMYYVPRKPQTLKTKLSSPVTYRFYPKDKTYSCIRGDPKIVFFQNEHGIIFPDNPDAPISIDIELNQNLFKNINLLPLYKEIQFFPPIPFEINPLKRRVAKLINNLAMIAHSFITRPDLREDIKILMEKNQQWAQFLNDSLSYELSGNTSPYKDNINSKIYGNSGMKAMLNLYEWLIADYQKFKDRNKLFTSEQSLAEWFQTVLFQNTRLDRRVPAPDFIKQHSSYFVKKARQYFFDIAKIEEYIRKDAIKKGKLSRLLVQEHLYKRKSTVRVLDGAPRIHAEMRLLEHHLTMHSTTSNNYFGITKLCCALCCYTLKQFSCIDFRGWHGTLYPGWQLSEIIRIKFLRNFLNNELYDLHRQLQQKYYYFSSIRRNIKQSNCAEKLFSELSFLNNQDVFQELGILLQYLLPGASTSPLASPTLTPVTSPIVSRRNSPIFTAGNAGIVTDSFLSDSNPIAFPYQGFNFNASLWKDNEQNIIPDSVVAGGISDGQIIIVNNIRYKVQITQNQVTAIPLVISSRTSLSSFTPPP